MVSRRFRVFLAVSGSRAPSASVFSSTGIAAVASVIRPWASRIRRSFHDCSESPLRVTSMIGNRAAMFAPQRAATPAEQSRAAASSGQLFAASRSALMK